MQSILYHTIQPLVMQGYGENAMRMGVVLIFNAIFLHCTPDFASKYMPFGGIVHCRQLKAAVVKLSNMAGK